MTDEEQRTGKIQRAMHPYPNGIKAKQLRRGTGLSQAQIDAAFARQATRGPAATNPSS